jgi:hypothetical protein
VDDDEVRRELAEVVREPLHRVGEGEVHPGRVVPVLIDILEDVVEPRLSDLVDGRAIAGEHVHAGGEDVGFEVARSVHLGDQRLELPEVGARAGQEQDRLAGVRHGRRVSSGIPGFIGP